MRFSPVVTAALMLALSRLGVFTSFGPFSGLERTMKNSSAKRVAEKTTLLGKWVNSSNPPLAFDTLRASYDNKRSEKAKLP
jgi:hypothetical protein